jgi:hypothetical protein
MSTLGQKSKLDDVEPENLKKDRAVHQSKKEEHRLKILQLARDYAKKMKGISAKTVSEHNAQNRQKNEKERDKLTLRGVLQIIGGILCCVPLVAFVAYICLFPAIALQTILVMIGSALLFTLGISLIQRGAGHIKDANKLRKKECDQKDEKKSHIVVKILRDGKDKFYKVRHQKIFLDPEVVERAHADIATDAKTLELPYTEFEKAREKFDYINSLDVKSAK